MEGAAERTYLLAPRHARFSHVRPTSFRIFVEAHPGNLTPGASLLEVAEEDRPPRARTAVRIASGEEGSSEPLGPNQVRVRVSYAPIHPGRFAGRHGVARLRHNRRR